MQAETSVETECKTQRKLLPAEHLELILRVVMVRGKFVIHELRYGKCK